MGDHTTLEKDWRFKGKWWCCCTRTQRTLLLSIVELKAASWLVTTDSSASQQDDEMDSISQPEESADPLQNVIEYSDDDDDVDFVNNNFDIV